MNTKMKTRMFSLLLCIVMLVGLLPATALAAEEITQVELNLNVSVIGNTLDF